MKNPKGPVPPGTEENDAMRSPPIFQFLSNATLMITLIVALDFASQVRTPGQTSRAAVPALEVSFSQSATSVMWTGTGEHYFLNGTTAFLLMGWDDEQMIRGCIDRLHGREVNRVRVLLDGRTDHSGRSQSNRRRLD